MFYLDDSTLGGDLDKILNDQRSSEHTVSLTLEDHSQINHHIVTAIGIHTQQGGCTDDQHQESNSLSYTATSRFSRSLHALGKDLLEYTKCYTHYHLTNFTLYGTKQTYRIHSHKEI